MGPPWLQERHDQEREAVCVWAVLRELEPGNGYVECFAVGVVHSASAGITPRVRAGPFGFCERCSEAFAQDPKEHDAPAPPPGEAPPTPPATPPTPAERSQAPFRCL